MAPKQHCAKYQYVVTPSGPKILPVDEPSCKDEESAADYNAGGYLPVKVNDTFKNCRYRVVRKLGWGHFSTVWLVKDAQSNNHSALKVVKSAGRYAETARDEIKLLSQVASCSPNHPGRSFIVSFLDSFSHQGPEACHVCIVFEPLGENLLALIERHKKKGVPRALVKVIAKQMLLGLQYLHDECDLVHTDIKPENILISIPDIEAHIHNELSQSPTPTSRRVGVPPTKSRAGVSIPHNQHRTSRRQVQIFDSQPLSSPGRSAGIRGSHGSSSINIMSSNHGGSGSGSGSGVNSLNGSYVAQMHMARLSGGTVGHASGTAASLSSRASKVSSVLLPPGSDPRHSATLESIPNPSNDLKKLPNTASSQPNGTTSPSTSSSSSSISSTLTSAAAGSSTPPTSLSHSLGSVVAGLMAMAKPAQCSDTSINAVTANVEKERAGLPMKGKLAKGKSDLECDSEIVLSSSWREKMGIGKDKVPITSSHKSNSSASGSQAKRTLINGQGHSRGESYSSSVSSSWQDPGVAAPAPAVVVSACVGADGEGGGDYFRLAGVGSASPGSCGASGGNISTSQGSSATVTAARPTPNGTPHPMVNSGFKTKSSSSSSRPNTANITTSTSRCGDFNEINSISASRQRALATNPNPSLLTQTAPFRVPALSSAPSKRSNARSSPAHHTSQLSAHIHSHPTPSDSPLNHEHYNFTFNNTSTYICDINGHSPALPAAQLSSNSAASITPTPISPQPPAPPPTPTLHPSSCPSAPNLALPGPSIVAPQTRPIAMSLNSPPPSLPTRGLAPSPSPPSISIKIADLGNATPSTKHYTEDIQTRQYRAPEAILGRKDWGTKVDVWSVACVVFELLTAEYLFDPQGQGDLFTKDDDHMAQIIELLGDFPVEVKMGGKYSREIFDHTGALRYIRTLKPWPLKRVMMEKYLFTESDARALCDFLEPMLAIDMRTREEARAMVDHKWLEFSDADETVVEW